MNLKYVLMALLIAGLSACNSAASPSSPTAEVEAVTQPIVKEVATLALVPAGPPAPQTTESGLQYIIIEEGTGKTPQTGDGVKAHYLGTLADGAKFDSSYDRGEPILFTLGTGEVIPGWDEGVSLLKVGGKAKLIIPPELGYGARGSGRVIPPNSTLYLEVELISIQPGSVAPAEVFEADYIITASGLKYYDFEVGAGDSPQPGQTVTVHYTGWFEDETMFDSSRLRGQPFSFVMDEGKVIDGWQEGVASMKVGGKRQLVISPELAYGEEGAGGGAIPPNTTLIFDVELLAIK